MLRQWLARRGLSRHRPGYRSRFGGLWTDRVDARLEVDRKLGHGELTPSEHEDLTHWIEHGFVVLGNAVDHDTIDRLNEEIEQVWTTLDPRFLVEILGVRSALSPELRQQNAKLLDSYAHSRLARELAFAPRVQSFLRRVFAHDILLFQSLSFEVGSEQPIHQDTAYVVTSSPMEFAAAWIALEDVTPGCGELGYYPGSHRFDEFVFANGARNWSHKRDGDETHARFLKSLHDQALQRQIELQRFCPKKGDVLIWNADLAHGGTPITRPDSTRRSLVCHYCPTDVEPYYFAYRRRHRRTLQHEDGALYSSSNYRL